LKTKNKEEQHERKRILSIPKDGPRQNPLASSTPRPRRHSEPQQASPSVRGGEAYRVIFRHPSPIPRQSSKFEGSIDGPMAVQPILDSTIPEGFQPSPRVLRTPTKDTPFIARITSHILRPPIMSRIRFAYRAIPIAPNPPPIREPPILQPYYADQLAIERMLMRKVGRVQHSPPLQAPTIANFEDLSFNNPPISSQGPQSPLYSNPGTQVGPARIVHDEEVQSILIGQGPIEAKILFSAPLIRSNP